jgi:hypothetical protein
MNAPDDPTVVRDTLARMTLHAPDPARAARTRARARAAFAAQVRRRSVTARVAPRGGWHAALEPLLVAGACAVFLFEVLTRATRLYGF